MFWSFNDDRMIHKLLHHNHDQHSESLTSEFRQEEGERATQLRKVVLFGCLVNIGLMILKLAAGYYGHSDALMADGYHALNDVAADLLMLFFVGISYRKPDSKFGFGYGKFETFSAFIISVLLLFVAWHIGHEAVDSIIEYIHGEDLSQPYGWTLIVIIIAMAAKEGLYRYYRKVGSRIGSMALLSNALHHRSDAMASIATLIGVGCAVAFGPSWRIMDPIASLVLMIFILIPALRLLIKSFMELMDKSVSQPIIDEAKIIIDKVPGQFKLVSIRGRRSGHYFVFSLTIDYSDNLEVGKVKIIEGKIVNGLKERFGRDTICYISIDK